MSKTNSDPVEPKVTGANTPMPTAGLEVAPSPQAQQNAGLERLKAGLSAMGLNQSEVELAMSLRGLKAGEAEKAIGLMAAGISVNTLKIMGEMRKLEARIEANNFSFNEKGDPTEEAMVRESYHALLGEFRKYAELVLKGSVIQAKLEAIRQAARGQTPKRGGRAGFIPKSRSQIPAATQVNAENVNLLIQT